MADDSLPEATDSSFSHSDPSLSRNVSFSRLNARAPEFVPTRPSFRPDLQQHHSVSVQGPGPSPPPSPPPPRILIPPPPPPPLGMVHVYHSPQPPASPFHVPFHPHPPQHHRPHHIPIQYHPHHPHQYYGSGAAYAEQEPVVQQAQFETDHGASSKTKLSEESTLKLLNQVEYYFSDLNLATTDHLMRFINKDPEGYVPISVVASFKKIKALISSHSHLAKVLRTSLKLVVSEDGKKVRRQQPFTESDMEELQSRIVVAENLPEDHCHQNLMKIFSIVGSVKTMRTCQPQTSSAGASSTSRLAKADGTLYSNKLHAFVEYETVELAEKAVVELNDEGNWRSGLRVRLMFKRTSKSAQARGKKGRDGEVNCEEDDSSDHQRSDKQAEGSSQQFEHHQHERPGEESINEKDTGQRKGRNKGHGKGRGRSQYHHHNSNNNNNWGNHMGPNPTSGNAVSAEQSGIIGKQPPGPRMPDGTRGFAMGRGRPIAVNVSQ